MSFDLLGLAPEITRALAERGYNAPTPIQAQAIPPILAGRDILAGAQTGTGKTAGFVVPILQRLHAAEKRQRDPRVLILVPTRELAAQVHESVRGYGKFLSFRSTVVFGGVGINPQIDALDRGVNILVATPGRLLDLAEQGHATLDFVETLVLDEADRMLDMGFIHDIKRIMKRLPKKRQNLMFSATYSDDIRQLAQGLLRDPVEIEVARRNAAIDVIEQYMYPVAKDQKRALLSHLIRSGDWMQVLVFTRTKHGANRLAQQLQDDGIATAAIHGNKSQGARTTALRGFKEQKIRALIATEVAARGLDIKELPHVVNYELPNVPEDYVHRIGRTGRAGASGEAVSLVAPDENSLLKDIERTTRKTIERRALPIISAPPPRAPGSVSAEQPERTAQRRPASNGRPRQNNSGRSNHNNTGNRSGNSQRSASDGNRSSDRSFESGNRSTSNQSNSSQSNSSQSGVNRSVSSWPNANRPSAGRAGGPAHSANYSSRPRGRG